jgi:hypothetical protein
VHCEQAWTTIRDALALRAISTLERLLACQKGERIRHHLLTKGGAQAAILVGSKTIVNLPDAQTLSALDRWVGEPHPCWEDKQNENDEAFEPKVQACEHESALDRVLLTTSVMEENQTNYGATRKRPI